MLIKIKLELTIFSIINISFFSILRWRSKAISKRITWHGSRCKWVKSVLWRKTGWTLMVEIIELHKIIGKDFYNNQSAISLLLVWSIKTCIILFQKQNFASWNILSWHQMKYFFISPMHNMWADIRKFSKLYLAHPNFFHFLSSDEK